MIRRPPRSTLDRSSAASDVYKRQDLGYAEQRAHFEPLIEMMQVKGNSEVHRKFWPADEFADFENADSLAKFSERVIEKRNFVRAGVTSGLAWEQKLGANPYKLGFVGGTCLLYTSDAADERSSVDLGGRRILKKKKTQQL